MEKKMDKKEILSRYTSVKCFCGKLKHTYQSFCFECYQKLPREMKTALWKRFGYGYEEAYVAAVRKLQEIKNER